MCRYQRIGEAGAAGMVLISSPVKGLSMGAPPIKPGVVRPGFATQMHVKEAVCGLDLVPLRDTEFQFKTNAR